MPKEIDDFSVCGETWYGITQLQDIIEHLAKTVLWLEASGNVDEDVLVIINIADNHAFGLRRQLIDLQIKLLTVL